MLPDDRIAVNSSAGNNTVALGFASAYFGSPRLCHSLTAFQTSI